MRMRKRKKLHLLQKRNDKTIDGHAPWVKAQPNPKSKIKKFEKTPIPKSKKLPTAGNGQDKKMDIRYLDQYKKYNKVPKL